MKAEYGVVFQDATKNKSDLNKRMNIIQFLSKASFFLSFQDSEPQVCALCQLGSVMSCVLCRTELLCPWSLIDQLSSALE